MKAPLTVILVIIVAILGFMIVYSQTGLPEKGEDAHAAAGGYGGGAASRAVDYGTMAIVAVVFLGILLSGPIKKIIGRK